MVKGVCIMCEVPDSSLEFVKLCLPAYQKKNMVISLGKCYGDFFFRTMSEASQNIQFDNIVTKKTMKRVLPNSQRPPRSIKL